MKSKMNTWFGRSILVFAVAAILTASQTAAAKSAPKKSALKKAPSAQVMSEAIQNNKKLQLQYLEFQPLAGVTAAVRPFADYEKAGYVFISDAFEFSSREAKIVIADNLPKDVTLVIFTEDNSRAHVASLKSTFGKNLPTDRLKVIELANASEGFWARDGLPVPVIDEATSALALVDARYYYPFEPDREIGSLFGAKVSTHKFNFEGGNFMANAKGHCLMVNNQSHSKIPDSIFETLYGCRQVDRLPHVEGIGHVDEHVRFVSEDTVLTDLPEYAKTLEANGLKAIMLPRPNAEMETYVNSLLVNGVAIVPTFGEATDKVALQVYESLGIKAIGANSSSLSNDGEGSIHCITMTYPDVPFAVVLKSLHAREL